MHDEFVEPSAEHATEILSGEMDFTQSIHNWADRLK
jgi:hypothetical protein